MKKLVTDNHPAGTILHTFEAAGLGKAPFLCIGVNDNMWSPAPGVPAKPGGTCKYCYNGIRWEYLIKDAEGKTFVVGSDCVRKTGDAGLRRTIRMEEKRRRDAKHLELVSKYFDMLKAHLDDPAKRSKMAEMPHPKNFDGMTMLDYVEFIKCKAGLAGIQSAVKMLDKLFTPSVDILST